MRFYNREKEISILSGIMQKKGFTFVVVSGRRRVGKTRLLKELMKSMDYIYVYVPKYKTTDAFLDDVSSSLGIPRFTKISDMILYLFEKYPCIFFDEFQNFYYMDKSIYSDFQDIIDKYDFVDKNLSVFVSGSSYSLIKKIFSDYAHPLYGRQTLSINLNPLEFGVVSEIMRHIGYKDIETIIEIYSVFGGIPKYYELIEKIRTKNSSKIMKSLFFDETMPLLKEEGRIVIISEFGGEFKIFFSVLGAIASGKTKLNEIAGIFGNDSRKAMRYLDLLRNEHGLVVRETPLLSDPRKSRDGIYLIKDNFLRFWFAFVKRYDSYYEQDKTSEVYSIFMKNFNSFVGMGFEQICKEFMKKINKKSILPFSFEKIGRQWGRIKGKPKGENSYEIDIVALNEKAEKILFMECKWKELKEKDARNIIEELKEKSGYVNWSSGGEKEFYGIIARKIENKEILRKKGYVVFDLQDFEKTFK